MVLRVRSLYLSLHRIRLSDCMLYGKGIRNDEVSRGRDQEN